MVCWPCSSPNCYWSKMNTELKTKSLETFPAIWQILTKNSGLLFPPFPHFIFLLIHFVLSFIKVPVCCGLENLKRKAGPPSQIVGEAPCESLTSMIINDHQCPSETANSFKMHMSVCWQGRGFVNLIWFRGSWDLAGLVQVTKCLEKGLQIHINLTVFFWLH